MRHLHLISGQSTFKTCSSPLSDQDTESLWRCVREESAHHFIREPVLLELARRNELAVLDY
ncbi:MAG: hypothetical protein RTU30_14910, partial [Candidatus Thorarchaeota archaeon]